MEWPSEKTVTFCKSPIPLLVLVFQWGRNLECQVAFDGLKQATIEGPSLGIADATKPPKVEAEQFNYMLGEYLHHFVDGRQWNGVQLLNVVQFSHSTQIDSLIRRIQFEINGSRHSVLSPLADGPYIGNNPQVHRVEKEWEPMADIARVCLEDALLSSSGWPSFLSRVQQRCTVICQPGTGRR
ncbi:reverse transcriptase [Cucumis melo var. makuwa]|uniref:Reverse transcriptase n=1 Tax=Cucumis melo var. makuwa TaxID=1194695 RepID=A0A5D3BQ66_CUCMM|nr:reverse transcriptase [Cucumis melo var. makuwa]